MIFSNLRESIGNTSDHVLKSSEDLKIFENLGNHLRKFLEGSGHLRKLSEFLVNYSASGAVLTVLDIFGNLWTPSTIMQPLITVYFPIILGILTGNSYSILTAIYLLMFINYIM